MALEAGKVVMPPDLAFRVHDQETLLLSDNLLSARRKNLSLDPTIGWLRGSVPRRALLTNILQRFATNADTLLRALLNPYVSDLHPGSTRFRPAEIADRCYSPRQDDRQVPHAALSVHLTLEQTFHLPVCAMEEPGRSPLRILERMTGRPLVDAGR